MHTLRAVGIFAFLLFFSSQSFCQFQQSQIVSHEQYSPPLPTTLIPNDVEYSDFVGLEFVNKSSFIFRPYVGRGTRYNVNATLTEAIAYDRNSSVFRFSINPIFFIPYYTIGSLPDKEWLLRLIYQILYVPELIPNISLFLPLLDNRLDKSISIGVEQRTDYFLLNTPARIYTESAAALRLMYRRITGEFRFAYPLSKGFLESKKPYFSASIYWKFFDREHFFLVP